MNWLLFETGSGAWAPLLWAAGFVVAVAIALLVRSRGEKGYKKGTAQEEPFFSGNAAPEKGIGEANAYWGFFAAMEKYYNWAREMHSGIVNDYVYAFVILVLLLALAAVGGWAWL